MTEDGLSIKIVTFWGGGALSNNVLGRVTLKREQDIAKAKKIREKAIARARVKGGK